MSPPQPESRDRLLRFLVGTAGVRGVHVRLDETWRRVRERATYPAPAAALLGQACAAAALFTGHTKVGGRLSVQLRSDGAIRTLFAECTAAGTLRGIVRVNDEAQAPLTTDLRALGPGGVLAITIENPDPSGREPTRYQGLVPLEADRLDRAFEDYFRHSEQLPTRLILAASETVAAGLLIQKLPGDQGDLDGWNRCSSIFETVGQDELLALDGAELSTRLFHEDGLEFLGEKPLAFACSCSQGRVEAVLLALGLDEARQAVIGEAAVVACEFCGQRYLFDAEAVENLFRTAARTSQGPDRAQ